MTRSMKSAALAAAFVAFGGAAHAACATDVAKDDLTDEQVAELYACIEAELLAGYQGSGRPEAEGYRSWPKASTTPFVSATHGGRFVNHYVNETGAAAYLAFADEGASMPVGAIAAKESFTVSKDGKVQKGPLFLMEKMADGFDETGGWKYAAILPNGQVMGETGTETGAKVAFCHGRHEAVLEGRDAMFYPDEDYRMSAGQ